MIFPVIECRLRYRAPARYDDVLTVETWLTTAEKVRMNFAYRIVNQAGTGILEAETQHVCTSLAEKPKRLPEELTTLLPAVLFGSEGKCVIAQGVGRFLVLNNAAERMRVWFNGRTWPSQG